MKIPSATATVIAAIFLLCAFSTGGQQQQTDKGKQQTPGFTPIAPKRKTPAKPSDWRMPDGRVIEFPASTSKEEIDALAKRIADGAVELPPGARVIGWEPVEGANALLAEFDQRVATIPTTKGKLDALANAADILQRQIIVLQIRLDAERAAKDAGFKSTDKTLNNHADNFDALAAQVAYLAQLAQQHQMEKQNLKRDLDDFKEAACPLLRSLRASGMKLDYACGLH